MGMPLVFGNTEKEGKRTVLGYYSNSMSRNAKMPCTSYSSAWGECSHQEGRRAVWKGSWKLDSGSRIKDHGFELSCKLYLDDNSYSTCKAGDIGCISWHLFHHSCFFSLLLPLEWFWTQQLLFLCYFCFLCLCTCFRYWWSSTNRASTSFLQFHISVVKFLLSR